jgi:hypothetical protein
VEPNLRYQFDYGDPNTAQFTSSISLGTINPASIFGEAVFGLNTFGAVSSPLIRLPLQGSGHSNSFTFQTQDTKSPYTVNGFYIDYIPSGRR